MSRQPAAEPAIEPAPCPGLETVIAPRMRDLGGFQVRRVLPATGRRIVGPFVFFDHMGPTAFAAGAGIDLRPHPQIGLATVTSLFKGEIRHRDGLGTMQPIRPPGRSTGSRRAALRQSRKRAGARWGTGPARQAGVPAPHGIS